VWIGRLTIFWIGSTLAASEYGVRFVILQLARLTLRATTGYNVEESEMGIQQKEKLSFKTSFCGKYEELLVQSQNALEVWANRREEAWQMGLRGRELGGELIRLQADFAKAYARLQKHTHECPLCEFVANIAKEDSQAAYLITSQESRPA
jgi:hypothetical protein